MKKIESLSTEKEAIKKIQMEILQLNNKVKILNSGDGLNSRVSMINHKYEKIQ